MRTRRQAVKRSGVLPAPDPSYPGNLLEVLSDAALGDIRATVDAAKE
ncbi:hypothetical protein AB0K48_11195 [Nonomuraea sp. NPDC055795]